MSPRAIEILTTVAGLALFAMPVLLVLLVLYRICTGLKSERKLHRFPLASEDVGPTIVCTQEGMFRVNDRGEWIPFSDREAA